MLYANPGAAGAKVAFKSRYDNFIGGKFVPPVKGQYFDVITPTTGKVYTKAARSTAEDIELALDAAHAAEVAWGKTDAATRSNLLLKIADPIFRRDGRTVIPLKVQGSRNDPQFGLDMKRVFKRGDNKNAPLPAKKVAPATKPVKNATPAAKPAPKVQRASAADTPQRMLR